MNFVSDTDMIITDALKPDLKHVGAPYANFVTGSGDGLDVELVKLFAQKLNLKGGIK